MRKESYAELGVQSDILTAEQITSILGMPADKSWVKDAPIPAPRNVARCKHHGWNIRTFLPEEAQLEDHIAEMLKRLSPVKEKVKQVSRQADVTFCCVIYTTPDDRPSLFFDAEVIAAIAEMGAAFWIDMYEYSDEFYASCGR